MKTTNLNMEHKNRITKEFGVKLSKGQIKTIENKESISASPEIGVTKNNKKPKEDDESDGESDSDESQFAKFETAVTYVDEPLKMSEIKYDKFIDVLTDIVVKYQDCEVLRND